MNLSDQNSTLDVELKTISGRVVLLETAVGLLLTNIISSDGQAAVMSQLKKVKTDLQALTGTTWKNDLVSVLEAGPNKEGPSATLRP
jgi:hypothetical protein